MNQSIKTLITALRRPAYLLVAAILLGVGLMSIPKAHAGQVQYRAIRMSDNGVSGGSITTGVGSGTGVTYRVFFKAATSYTAKGIVVDFCDGTTGTPFIGDSNCGAPANFTVGTTPAIDTNDYNIGTGGSTITTTGLGSGWTASSTNSGQTFNMTNTTGVALTAGTIYTFAISGITNTSTLGTFYARLLTYTSDTGSIATYTHASPGTYQDYGGFALSTARIVQVTAKVQETLTYCVSGYSSAAYTAAYNTYLAANAGDTVGANTAGAAAANGVAPTSCADSTVPALILGHGTNNTLDPANVDINNAWSIASTNALNGVVIRMHNSNACGGLSTDQGTTCAIPAVSSGAATPSKITPGTAAFGMFCSTLTGGTGTLACDSNYNNGTDTGAETAPVTAVSTDAYGMDSTSPGDNVSTTYGDTVATSTAPVNLITNKYQFAATASNTTPAGIYKANLAMVATGTF